MVVTSSSCARDGYHVRAKRGEYRACNTIIRSTASWRSSVLDRRCLPHEPMRICLSGRSSCSCHFVLMRVGAIFLFAYIFLGPYTTVARCAGFIYGLLLQLALRSMSGSLWERTHKKMHCFDAGFRIPLSSFLVLVSMRLRTSARFCTLPQIRGDGIQSVRCWFSPASGGSVRTLRETAATSGSSPESASLEGCLAGRSFSSLSF